MAAFSSVNTNIGKYIDIVDTIPALRAYNPTCISNGDAVLVSAGVTLGDSAGNAYVWVESSTKDDDGLLTIKPFMPLESGRWIKMFGQGPRGFQGERGFQGIQGVQGFKGDPGGNVMATGPFSDLVSQAVPAGITLIQTTGNDRGILIEDTTLTDANVAAHPLAITKTANGRYFRRDPRNLWIEQFGARSVPDKSFDSSPAINAAIKYSQFCAGTLPGLAGVVVGPKVQAGIGRFYLASRINVKSTLELCGQSNGHLLAQTATVFAVEESGFIFERQDTFNTTTISPATTGADGSRVHGITIIYVGSSLPRSGGLRAEFGILSKCMIDVYECTIRRFPGPAVYVWATSGAGGAAQGEASTSQITRNWLEECWAAVAIEGADANVIDVSNNRAFSTCVWGMYSVGFLNSNYSNNHFKANGQLVHYNGRRYQPMPGYESVWGTTVPGTNPNVWGYCEDGGPTATGYNGYDAVPTWVSGGTGYYAGGPVYHPSQNGRSVFINNYTEGGQPLPIIMFPAVSIGGQWAHAEGANGRFLNFEQGSTNSRSFIAATRENLPTVGRRAAISPEQGLTVYSGDLEYGLSMAPYGKDFRWTQGSADYAMSALITGDQTAQAFGRASTIPNSFWFNKGFVMGNRAWASSTTIPTTGDHAVGEIVWNTNPAAGGNIGWVCTTANVTGANPVAAVWKAFGAISSDTPPAA